MEKIFSKDELAALKNFAKEALKEDKRLHGIPEKGSNENKTKKLQQNNFYNQDKSKTVLTNNTNNNYLNKFLIKNEGNEPPPNQNKPIKPPESQKPSTIKQGQKPEVQEDVKAKYKDIKFVTFVSMDSKVQCGIKSLPKDFAAEVDDKPYEKYNNLKNTNYMYTENSKPILSFKKISENNIKDGDVLQLHKLE